MKVNEQLVRDLEAAGVVIDLRQFDLRTNRTLSWDDDPAGRYGVDYASEPAFIWPILPAGSPHHGIIEAVRRAAATDPAFFDHLIAERLRLNWGWPPQPEPVVVVPDVGPANAGNEDLPF